MASTLSYFKKSTSMPIIGIAIGGLALAPNVTVGSCWMLGPARPARPTSRLAGLAAARKPARQEAMRGPEGSEGSEGWG
eukprot:scaffold5316_cov105-Isochrysis_galbana.AAC.2